MLKAKIFSNTNVNALTSIKKKKKKILASLVLKKKSLFCFVLFLSLLVNYCIIMYLKTIIFCIYSFLILYRCLFEGFFFLYTPTPATLKSRVCPYLHCDQFSLIYICDSHHFLSSPFYI